MTLLNSPEVALAFLFACAIKATITLALALIIARTLRNHSAALRHQVWAAGILGSLALPFLTLLLPAWHSTALRDPSGFWTPVRGLASGDTFQKLPSMVIQASTSSPFFNRLAVLAVLFWAVGALITLLRLLAGITRVAWISAQSKPLFQSDWMHCALELSKLFKIARPVRMLQCANPIAMPITWGVFRPQILLPAGASEWLDYRQRVVLSHELAHISRQDWLLQIVAELVRAFYWFHPLAWFAAEKLRQESECACDDAVLNSGIPASAYADQLLALARTLQSTNHAWSAELAIARPSNLERRFIAMLNPSLNRAGLSARTKLFTAFAVCCVLFPLSAFRLAAQDISGQFTGTIYDPNRAAVPNATIVMTNKKTGTIDMTSSDAEGKFQFKALTAANYELKALKPGFKVYLAPSVVLEPSRDLSLDISIELGSITEEVNVIADGPSRPPESRATAKPGRIRIGGNVMPPKLLTKVQPLYPSAAKAAGIEGNVILHAVIGIDGKPLSIVVRNSQIDPELARAAVEAVSQWRYQPTMLNGEPVEVDTTVTVNFKLS